MGDPLQSSILQLGEPNAQPLLDLGMGQIYDDDGALGCCNTFPQCQVGHKVTKEEAREKKGPILK